MPPATPFRGWFPIAGLVLCGTKFSMLPTVGAYTSRYKYRIFAFNALPDDWAQVVPTTVATEIFKNGASLGTFTAGQVWAGPVADFDEFAAHEPIYMAQSRHGAA
jgi:hypothetical protein